jgi:hypothetical protein
MSKDFQELCPEVQISVNPNLLDYTVELNHTEYSFVRLNQIGFRTTSATFFLEPAVVGISKGRVSREM